MDLAQVSQMMLPKPQPKISTPCALLIPKEGYADRIN
ncbi:hypothetical protein HJJEPNFP_00021 [Ralstonia phage BOESR1]|nr:hypothetical protein HJJEPNFP_00021 [Ralstonia phage BOESR1]